MSALLLAMNVYAREESAEIAPLPSVEDLAQVLADKQQRQDALLTLAALAQLLHSDGGAVSDAGDRLSDDREWLIALQERFGPARPRSAVLDPGAWRLRTLLDQHRLESSPLTSTAGPEMEILLDQVFHRFNPRLAAAVLPQLLWHLESVAPMIWDDLLRQAAVDPALSALLAELNLAAAGVSLGEAPAEQLPAEDEPWKGKLQAAQATVGLMFAEAAGAGPPDPARLGQVRASLLAGMPRMSWGQRQIASMLLHLARLADGLNEGSYFHFSEGLLAIVTQLEQVGDMYPDEARAFAAWMAEMLPEVSAAYSRSFAAVDPRLNSALAASFDVIRNLTRVSGEQDTAGNARQLADAVAMLALLVPDMDYYFDLPVRDPVAGGVDACTGIVATRDADGAPAMTRELFDDCLQTLVDLADQEAREAQLAGDPDGPFGESTLQRELNLTSGQRINYGIGYLHDRYSTGCEAPESPLPNPLEWAWLATYLAWFSEQAPVYFQTPENDARIARMREIGLELMRIVAEQVDCVAGAGASVNDPVHRVTADYRDDLMELGRGMRIAEAEFRSQFLAPGADIALDGGPTQATAYRPDNLVIGPCDQAKVCEMNDELSSTRALLGLFPDLYLLADQTGLGKVEICYDNMEWVDRRSEPVRSGDENVANYFGHLAFDLRGRWVNQSDAVDLFGFRFKTPQEHHYMFAAATDEVLDDSCPVEWIGTKIVTTLPEGRRGIVPNRLTYLSAPRALPSRLLSQNWDQGAEWRDWFVTGIGVEDLPTGDLEDLSPRLGQHLRSLYRLEQEAVYGSILQASPDPDFAAMTPLHEATMRLTTSKDLVRTQAMLFYPQILNDDDQVRSALAGQGGLLDALVLKRFQEVNMPVPHAMEEAHARLERFQSEWQAQPEAVRRNGSIAESLSQAMVRLNTLYERNFARPAGGLDREESDSTSSAGR